MSNRCRSVLELEWPRRPACSLAAPANLSRRSRQIRLNRTAWERKSINCRRVRISRKLLLEIPIDAVLLSKLQTDPQLARCAVLARNLDLPRCSQTFFPPTNISAIDYFDGLRSTPLLLAGCIVRHYGYMSGQTRSGHGHWPLPIQRLHRSGESFDDPASICRVFPVRRRHRQTKAGKIFGEVSPSK